MTLALVAGIIFTLLCLLSLADKTKRANDWKKSKRGSQVIEQEEREKWSKLLFEEYCVLIGKVLNFPALEQTKYWRDFVGAEYQNKDALETLRAKHGLPSDEELSGTVYDRSFGKETNYGNLQRIIWFCVYRAIKQRGLTFNGIDFGEIRRLRLKNKKVHEKYPWLLSESKKDDTS